MERYFNVAGPNISGEHHMLPALVARFDTPGLSEGRMAVFDFAPDKAWSDKLYNRDAPFDGKTIHVVGL